MGKNKLSKFADMATYDHVVQVSFSQLQEKEFDYKGKWSREFFGNDNPVILELGCGKGEYTVKLAQHFPEFNFIGIDIKGSRMWKGAKYATENHLENVGFLRTSIELIHLFFAPNEVSEIWLTFPDPQMKRTRKRLTSTRFVELYRRLLKPDGIVHLKTDSNFQFQYTQAIVEANGFEVRTQLSDVYAQEPEKALQIKTYYEKQWLARGIKIKYISFVPNSNVLVEPDTYRSFGRGAVTVD